MDNEMYFIFAPADADGGIETISLTKEGTFKFNPHIDDLKLFDTIKSATRYINEKGLDGADFDIITNF
jgi:hypothetical protein